MGKLKKQVTGKHCWTATLVISCKCTEIFSAQINKKFKPQLFETTGKKPPVLQ